jgi:hypothetical protein
VGIERTRIPTHNCKGKERQGEKAVPLLHVYFIAVSLVVFLNQIQLETEGLCCLGHAVLRQINVTENESEKS